MQRFDFFEDSVEGDDVDRPSAKFGGCETLTHHVLFIVLFGRIFNNFVDCVQNTLLDILAVESEHSFQKLLGLVHQTLGFLPNLIVRVVVRQLLFQEGQHHAASDHHTRGRTCEGFHFTNVVLLQTFNGFLCLLQGGNSLLKGNSSSCCKFLCLFFLDVGFELFLVGFSLFFLSVGRFALHFLDKFVSLSSLLFDLHHFDFELLLKSQDL